jgi:twitching motility two-component system response regulator PilG
VDGYGLGAEQESGQDAVVEHEDASDDVWGRLTQSDEQAEQEDDDPLTALLDSKQHENTAAELLKPKPVAKDDEGDIWASLGMAGMEQAAPSAKTSAEPGEDSAAVAEEAAEEIAAEVADTATDGPAGATPEAEEVEQTAACFICEKLAPPQDGFCSACRAIVDLKLLELAPRHEGADRAQLNAALERVREQLDKKPSAKLCIQAALVCLNLRQSQQARLYLREACRLRPHDRELVGYYDQLEKRPLILAVDDSKTVQKMISTVLEKESYRVVQAEDGLGAIAKLDEEMPRLILLDITMPRMDGYQVCKVITGNDATKHIPVIMLSGKDGFFDKVRGKMVGASNYITKPFDPNELTKTIAKFLKN